MNPHQQNKVDINSLTPEEQRLLRLYGKMPTKKDVLKNKLMERKYFDSGDYALSKAGKASDVGVTNVGSRHPVPENIPHLTATSPNSGSSAQGQIPGSISGHPGSVGFQSRSPVKDGCLHRNSSLSEGEPEKEQELSVSPPAAREGVPIQR
ncbi:unnamed protein product [Penicillium salamii]|nr:unnamed protein product [Penicillium salamii]CAG8305537.1 unnamed protein product [Penicillium salamii]